MKRSSVFLSVALIFLMYAGASSAFAWTNPSANPTTGGGSIIAEQNSPGSIIYIKSNGNVGIGNVNPSAILQLKAGTAAANTAPLKFTSGINLTTPEAGAVEWNGTNLFVTQTSGPTRKTLAYTDSPLTGSLSAMNVSAGAFGANTGGGNYTFPGNVTIGRTTTTKKLEVYGGHGDTQARLYSIGDGANNNAFLNMWASEPGVTYTGVGIGNNVMSSGTSPYFTRDNTTRGGSYMRLLDNSIVFNTMSSAGTNVNVMSLAPGNTNYYDSTGSLTLQLDEGV